ncbi:MAG: hypothetical protein HC923_11915 [Myxococcales bacterium]|nr:hypothetical protein [Myxococcales bacterium]
MSAVLRVELQGGALAMVPVGGEALFTGLLDCPDGVLFGALERGRMLSRELRCAIRNGPEDVVSVEVSPASSPLFSVSSWSSSGATVLADLRFEAVGLARPHEGTVWVRSISGKTSTVSLSGSVKAPAPDESDLAASLTWNTNRIDLDIHIVRNERDPFTLGEDCHFADKNPDWGELGAPRDDCFLDRDATTGFGPEEANVFVAAEPRFDVYVMYHGYEVVFGERPTDATVQIFAKGDGPTVFTRTLESCGLLWHVASVTFSGGVAAVQSVDRIDDRFISNAAPCVVDAPCRRKTHPGAPEW